MKRTEIKNDFNTFTPKDPIKYDHARRLYSEGTPLKDISKRLDISAQTLTKWKKRGGWEQIRSANMLSPKTLYNKMLHQLDDLVEQGDPAGNADAISKICKQLRTLMSDTTVDQVITTLTECGDWIIENAEKLQVSKETVQEITRLHDNYISHKINKNSI